MKQSDGTLSWADITMKRIILDQKIRLMCVVSDISERVSLARFPDENPFPVLRVSADGSILYSNAGAADLRQAWGSAIPREVMAQITAALESDCIIEADLELGRRVYGLSYIPVARERYVNIYGRDITERRRAEKELRLAAEVFDTAGEGIFVTDPDGTILDVNTAYCEITGYQREEVIGQNPRMMKSNRHDRSFYTSMWGSIRNQGFWQGEVWDRRKSGEIYPKWLTINTVHGDSGGISHYVASFSDITEVKAKQERIEYLAHYDALTDLPNRTLFHERLTRSIATSRRLGRPLALLFIDLDRFKEINDTMGHPAGDELLRHVAVRLGGLTRESDTVCRLGGDEFTVILPHLTGSDDAARVARKILAACREPFDLMGRTVYISATIGITLCPEDSAEADTLIRNADTAMYHAKGAGRDRLQFFSSEMNESAQRRLELEMHLRRALESDEFHLAYQPKLDIQRRSYAGSEALIRWTSKDMGPISPGDFIPLAEETNLIIPLGEWVINEACRQIAEQPLLRERGLPVSINIAPVQFEQAGFVENLLAIMQSHDVGPELLEIEITESAVSGVAERSFQALAALRDHGIRVLIDDFGTGYSSLARLKDLPLDILKIDQSFVREIPQDQSANAVATSIIQLAHNLNMRVIAEGVETNEQLEFMREQQCDEIQGYLCCAPVPMDELIEQFR
jgi:diguanylate cyclase (GGDEF)-like protein/PAS domain S-box-containing protein